MNRKTQVVALLTCSPWPCLFSSPATAASDGRSGENVIMGRGEVAGMIYWPAAPINAVDRPVLNGDLVGRARAW